MPRPITVTVPHKLGKQEARRRIVDGFDVLQRQITGGFLGLVSFRQIWEGERLHFDGGSLGQRISGRLDVLDDAVQIEVDLPEFLAAIADRIKASLAKGTAKLLRNEN